MQSHNGTYLKLKLKSNTKKNQYLYQIKSIIFCNSIKIIQF